MRHSDRSWVVMLGFLGILSTYTAYNFISAHMHNSVESKNVVQLAPAQVLSVNSVGNSTSASKLILNNFQTKNANSTQDFSVVQEQLVSITKWNASLPFSMTRPDWCPARNSGGGRFVLNVYNDARNRHRTDCLNIQRIGARGDGGKNICVDNIRHSDCVVYSLGSRLDFTFENDMVARFGCLVHTFDCTVGVPDASKIPMHVHFHPWCVGGKDGKRVISSDLGHQGENGQYYSLQTIKQKLGHADIDILKMDIERHEFSVFNTLERASAPLQIAFETHLHNAYGLFGRPVSFNEWNSMWEKLSSMGYGVFAYEPNIHCFCCCEFSVLRGKSSS
mmetsp:Transcript_68012/g.110356  ORF Transcript_68012/g.110356 Transcript_68012/m.110356 type:complete len:334 (-) Transcript_68012:187-1188(-)